MTTLRRSPALAVALLLAVAGALIALQPVTSPWWTGGDADAVYVGSAVSLAGGRPTKYFDHPGTPLQELLGATLEARWLVGGAGTRASWADETFRDLNSTRAYFRSWAIVFYIGAILLVACVCALALGDWLAGVLAGLLFLGAPDVARYAIEFRPDVVLGAIAMAIAGLLVLAVRRRSAGAYLAAAAITGFGITVKVHAAGMLLPFAVALALARPDARWPNRLADGARAFVRRHRAATGAATAMYLGIVVLLNIGSAGAPRGRVESFVAAVAAILALCAVAAWVGLRTRRASITLLASLVAAALAGAILPNLFYAGTLPTMARWVVLALIGRGVNTDARPLSGGLTALAAWAPYAAVAAVGFVRGVRARDREPLIWGASLVAMAGLAAARFATPHYFIPAIAVAAPLVLRALVDRRGRVAAAAIAGVALLLVVPGWHIVRDTHRHSRTVRWSDALNAWAERHLARGEVAVTTLTGNGPAYVDFIRPFTVDSPRRSFWILPADTFGMAEVRGRRIQYLIHEPDRVPNLSSLGLRLAGPAPNAPEGIDAVARP